MLKPTASGFYMWRTGFLLFLLFKILSQEMSICKIKICWGLEKTILQTPWNALFRTQSFCPIGLIVAKINSLKSLELSSFGSGCYSSKPKSPPCHLRSLLDHQRKLFFNECVCVHFITTTLFSCRHTPYTAVTLMSSISTAVGTIKREMRKRGREMGRVQCALPSLSLHIDKVLPQLQKTKRKSQACSFSQDGLCGLIRTPRPTSSAFKLHCMHLQTHMTYCSVIHNTLSTTCAHTNKSGSGWSVHRCPWQANIKHNHCLSVWLRPFSAIFPLGPVRTQVSSSQNLVVKVNLSQRCKGGWKLVVKLSSGV